MKMKKMNEEQLATYIAEELISKGCVKVYVGMTEMLNRVELSRWVYKFFEELKDYDYANFNLERCDIANGVYIYEN
jgi:hypothetical protein